LHPAGRGAFLADHDFAPKPADVNVKSVTSCTVILSAAKDPVEFHGDPRFKTVFGTLIDLGGTRLGPNGIPSFSPGLRGKSYPGFTNKMPPALKELSREQFSTFAFQPMNPTGFSSWLPT
jgi:hypothetical protein